MITACRCGSVYYTDFHIQQIMTIFGVRCFTTVFIKKNRIK